MQIKSLTRISFKFSQLLLPLRYTYCTTHLESLANRNKNSSLIGKLTTRDSIQDILTLFQQNNHKFNLQQIAVACRVIAKNITSEKDRLDNIHNKQELKIFAKLVEESVAEMNQIQLLDVVYLLRKQKIADWHIFTMKKQVLNRVHKFINEDAYSLRNLVSLLYSIKQVLKAIELRINGPDIQENRREVTFSTTSELINAIAHNKLIPTNREKSIIIKFLSVLAVNSPEQKREISLILNIMYALSQIYMHNLKDLPFVKEFLSSFMKSFQNIAGGEILNLLAIGKNTNDPNLIKICKEVKRGIFKLLKEDVFELEFVMKVLREIHQWNQASYLTREEQHLVVQYFQSNINILSNYNFNFHNPKFIRLFSPEIAQAICHVILKAVQKPNLLLLSTLSEHIDITQRLSQLQNFQQKKDLSLSNLLKLFIIFSNSRNIPTFYLQLQQQLPNLLKKKIQLLDSATKNFIKQVPIEHQHIVRQILFNQIMQLTPSQFSQLSKKNEFIFLLINLLDFDTQILRQLITKPSQLKDFNKINYKSVTEMIASSRHNSAYKFWQFANIISLSPTNVFQSLNMKFVYRSVSDIDHSHHMTQWIVNNLNRLPNIDSRFVDFVLMILQFCKSSKASKMIIQTLLEKTNNLAQLSNSSTAHLLNFMKRQGYLTQQVYTFFTQRNPKLAIHPLTVLFGSMNNLQQIKKIIKSTKSISSASLQFFLLYPFQHWIHLKEEIVSYLQTKEMSIQGWKQVITSLKMEYMGEEHYKEIVAIISNKLLKVLQKNRHLQQYLHILYRLLQINYKSTKTQALQAIQRILATTSSSGQIEGCLNCLRLVGQNKFKYLLSNDKIDQTRIRYVWLFDMQISQSQIPLLFQMIKNQNVKEQQKQDLLYVLILNDHVESVRHFLLNNLQDIITKNTPLLLMLYLNKTYLKQDNKFDYPINRLLQLPKNEQKIIQNKLQNMDLDFQIRPKINQYQFNYRISNAYILFADNKQFQTLPSLTHKNNHLPKHFLSLKRKILQSLVGNSNQVFIVPKKQMYVYQIIMNKNKCDKRNNSTSNDDNLVKTQETNNQIETPKVKWISPNIFDNIQ